MLGVDRCCKRQTLLNAMKAKESALSARKPLVGGLEPHLCYRPFKPRAYIGIYHLLLSSLTTVRIVSAHQRCMKRPTAVWS